jgi:hypothetical protein
VLRVKRLFDDEFGNSKSNEYWLAWRYSDTFRDWDGKTFAAIQFGNLADDLENLIKRLARVARRACDTTYTG